MGQQGNVASGKILALAVLLGAVPLMLPLALSYFISPQMLMSLVYPLIAAALGASVILYFSCVVVPTLKPEHVFQLERINENYVELEEEEGTGVL